MEKIFKQEIPEMSRQIPKIATQKLHQDSKNYMQSSRTAP